VPLLSILLFLNELSFSTSQPIERVDEVMESFVGVLRHVRQRRSEAALVAAVKLNQIELAAGYFVEQWIAARSRNKELWRVIQSMRSRAPYSDVLPPGAGEGVDIRWNGLEAQGLCAAYLMDGLLVSLLVDSAWDTPQVQGTCTELVETDDGEADFDEYPIDVRHAAKIEHVEVHDDWLRQAGIAAFRNGSEIWAAREDLYPNLQFLPDVEDQLRDLRQDWVVSVADRLRTLEEAIADWDPKVQREPSWRTEVTSEAEQRKRLCWFIDLDGAQRLFDLHARFRPHQGRIHFRLIPENHKARIAYIGLKRGI
jgi:hypothetical protein